MRTGHMYIVMDHAIGEMQMLKKLSPLKCKRIEIRSGRRTRT